MKASIAYDIEKYLWLMGIPRGPKSKAYCYDPVNGSDNNVGTNWLAPLKTLAAAEDLCVANQHDAVVAISGATADNPTAMIGWDKAYTHLVGFSTDLFGLGQRCRVVSQAAYALTVPITFSGDGCIVKNMQFNNEKATGAAAGCGIVSGSRCRFENVFWMAPTANDAASYSLKVTGSENLFLRNTIGQFTNPRANASYSLWMTGAPLRNEFVKCKLLSWSTVNSHVLFKVGADISSEGFVTFFEECLWDNLNGGADLAHAVVDGATEVHHQIVLEGINTVIGCSGFADVTTYVYSNAPIPVNTFWTAVNPSH